MPFFPSMRENAGVADLYRESPQIYRHWIRMGEEVMTNEAPLSQGERELIASYVSALNNCDYCVAAHLPSMKLHGIDEQVVHALVQDIETAPVEERWKPLLRFVKKLTLAPATLKQDDAAAVFEAGWDEAALNCAIAVTCRFSFMNRLVMGYGLEPPAADAAMANAKRRLSSGYAGMHSGLDAKTSPQGT